MLFPPYFTQAFSCKDTMAAVDINDDTNLQVRSQWHWERFDSPRVQQLIECMPKWGLHKTAVAYAMSYIVAPPANQEDRRDLLHLFYQTLLGPGIDMNRVSTARHLVVQLTPFGAATTRGCVLRNIIRVIDEAERAKRVRSCIDLPQEGDDPRVVWIRCFDIVSLALSATWCLATRAERVQHVECMNGVCLVDYGNETEPVLPEDDSRVFATAQDLFDTVLECQHTDNLGEVMRTPALSIVFAEGLASPVFLVLEACPSTRGQRSRMRADFFYVRPLDTKAASDPSKTAPYFVLQEARPSSARFSVPCTAIRLIVNM